MGRKLVIVESPAKAKTIGRYLGKDYRIAASVGHIRDLPASTLGVDVRKDYKPTYINMRGKEKVIRELKELANDSEAVLIATDPDREGEAIAWHIASILKIDPSTPCRISFNEITQKALKEAIERPQSINLHLVYSQQARRILDRLVGYELSPFLWQKVRKGLSAGRVQSVATRLVVDRENEIRAHVSEEYWLLSAKLSPKGDSAIFTSKYAGIYENDKLKKVKLENEEQTQAVIKAVEGSAFVVEKINKGQKMQKPQAPFTTSTLQQEASRRLSFSSRKTMSVAQQLYEGVQIGDLGQTALVSYIRSDSVRVSQEALSAAKDHIISQFGVDYALKKPRVFTNKNASQDAHEAIRPIYFNLSPQSIRESLTPDQYRLYKLIWDRFIASQMTPAKVNTVTVDIACGHHIFRSQGETVVFQGFLLAYAAMTETNNLSDTKDVKERIPELSEKDILDLKDLIPEQKFTQPPARYTEASLIKMLEEKGIGRPSTYAPTISTILERNYVEKDGRYLLPTELGFIVTQLLEKHFKGIVDIGFTADMEQRLDLVETGENDWVSLLSAFYPSFHEQVEKAMEEAPKVKMEEIKTGEMCPTCKKGELLIKQGRYGKFVACSAFPDCDYTKNVEVPAKGICPLCGSGLLVHRSRKFKGRPFFTCDKKKNDPDCPFISWYLPLEGRTCETCGSYMVIKKYRGKTYPACSNRECPSIRRPTKKSDDKDDEKN